LLWVVPACYESQMSKTMLQKPNKPRLAIVNEVEDVPDATEGDFHFYRERRLRKYGSPPVSTAGEAPPLVREKLVDRRLSDVVAASVVDRKVRAGQWLELIMMTLGAVVIVLFVLLALGRLLGG
jgi:hypothetical protein